MLRVFTRQKRRKRPRPGHVSLPVAQWGLRPLTGVRLGVRRISSPLQLAVASIIFLGAGCLVYPYLQQQMCLLQAVFYNLSCPRSNISPHADCSPGSAWHLDSCPRFTLPSLHQLSLPNSSACPPSSSVQGSPVSEIPPLLRPIEAPFLKLGWFSRFPAIASSSAFFCPFK